MSIFLRTRLWVALLITVLFAVPNPLVAADSVTPSTSTNDLPFHMLIPGFTVRELPVKLTSLNNIEYAPDGRLFAGGYDGRFHLLRDTDGDGLEDHVDTFWSQTSPNYPLGIVVKDGDPYFILTDEIVRFRDTNGDGIPDKRETVVKGFDDPALAAATNLIHRRVDSSMGLAFGPDGAWYTTMGSAAYNNPWWQDKEGVPQYTTDKRRGCLLRLTPDGKVEQLASGLRYIMSLQWNRNGDLFATDQEGATWCPNGNPFDELMHLQEGRHYGFPPRHPKLLPNVVDEPNVWDYTPQHESTCGFRFNGPLPGRGRLGPEFWTDNAFVTGESRGKLWRTILAKTAAGYVARTELIARLGLLVVDCAISPKGDLVVCCHTGKPDWGNGPNGAGRLFKISYTGQSAPQPVLTWAASDTETVIAFDRPLDPGVWSDISQRTKMEFGRYVTAADRFETIRPGYKVVQMQQRQPRTPLPVTSASLSLDGRNLVIVTPPRNRALSYAVTIDGVGATPLDLAFDLNGLGVDWRGNNGGSWQGWLPHPDFTAAREFTKSSVLHDEFWKDLAESGTLMMRARFDLWNMLQPATQPGSQLDYTPEPETVTLVLKSDASVRVTAPGAKVQRISAQESQLVFPKVTEGRWYPVTITVGTPAKTLDVSYFTDRDPRPRALGTRRFLMPFAVPGGEDKIERNIPELAGGNWQKGHELFTGKAACVTCHTLRGEGAAVGPDLNNLVHRDYASVLRDIVDPNAVINPDAIGYNVALKNGDIITGTRAGETEDMLNIAQPGGQVAKLKRKDIAKVETMTISLMPTGLDKALTPEELRDLLTYLLTEPDTKKSE